jgi:hypothetical protein
MSHSTLDQHVHYYSCNMANYLVVRSILGVHVTQHVGMEKKNKRVCSLIGDRVTSNFLASSSELSADC